MIPVLGIPILTKPELLWKMLATIDVTVGRRLMMTCERIEELLSAYLEGELAPAEKAEVEAHLAACAKCAGLAALTREEMAAAAAWREVEPSPMLMARLYAIPGTKREKKRFFQPGC